MDLESPASTCRLSGMSHCPATLLPIPFPFLCPFAPGVPQVLQRHIPGHVLSPSLWALGFFCLSSNSHSLGTLPLAQPVPCSVYLQEILASPSAIAVEFSSWQRIKSNSPALSQIPTNPTCSTGSRACCCGAGALWCHTGGDGTRTRLHIMC